MTKRKRHRHKIFRHHKGLCYFCKKTVRGSPWQVHHIKPRSEGGTEALWNKAPVHTWCHRAHHASQVVPSKRRRLTRAEIDEFKRKHKEEQDEG